MAELNVRWLYYLAHIDNLLLLLERGILSQKIRSEENIPYTRIAADMGIVNIRKDIFTDDLFVNPIYSSNLNVELQLTKTFHLLTVVIYFSLNYKH